ncbi:Flp family type IVb pilin [bacterium]|nr:Flp family type IVb pilin [bacterium]
MKVRRCTYRRSAQARVAGRFARATGQALVEYALILSLISVAAIVSLRGIGQSIETKLQSVNSNLE